jgi:hypothetical protein
MGHKAVAMRLPGHPGEDMTYDDWKGMSDRDAMPQPEPAEWCDQCEHSDCGDCPCCSGRESAAENNRTEPEKPGKN